MDSFHTTTASGELTPMIEEVQEDAVIDDIVKHVSKKSKKTNQLSSLMDHSEEVSMSNGTVRNGQKGEEDDEIFKKRKRNEQSPSAADIAMWIEKVLATLEVAAEEDVELNKQSMPAVNKLKKLPHLIQVLSKKQLQLTFLDHGVLGVLKAWLEPLPDGSLPNVIVRSAILKLLSEFPINLDQDDRIEQLKRSGLGKVIMFLSRTDEETTVNRKCAKDLVDRWSRMMFDIRPRFEDQEEKILNRPRPKAPAIKAARIEFRDAELEFPQRKRAASQPSKINQRVSRPEASTVHFVISPQSKIDADQIRERARQAALQEQHRLKMNMKLKQLKAKKRLQATKLSAEGRGLVTFF